MFVFRSTLNRTEVDFVIDTAACFAFCLTDFSFMFFDILILFSFNCCCQFYLDSLLCSRFFYFFLIYFFIFILFHYFILFQLVISLSILLFEYPLAGIATLHAFKINAIESISSISDFKSFVFRSLFHYSCFVVYKDQS